MIKLPSLSEQGWVTNPSTALANILSYYILSDGAQSLIFKDNVINLPATYHLHINDPVNMAQAVETELGRLLGRYYEIVDIKVDVKQMNEKSHGIIIYSDVIDESGIKVSLGKVVSMGSTGLKKVIDINNYGDGINALAGGGL